MIIGEILDVIQKMQSVKILKSKKVILWNFQIFQRHNLKKQQ